MGREKFGKKKEARYFRLSARGGIGDRLLRGFVRLAGGPLQVPGLLHPLPPLPEKIRLRPPTSGADGVRSGSGGEADATSE